LDLTKTRESGFLRFRDKSPRHKAPDTWTHLRNNIVYHCYKFLLHDSEEPRE
jgi:hypothetical protein